MRWTCLVVLTLILVHRERAYAEDKATLAENVKRVVFLGDSITHGGQYITDIETYFVTRYPDRPIELINLGLPSETVSGLSEPGHAGGKFDRPDLHERLARVLEQTRPDLVFACYGMNDGIYMPFSDERFAKFKEGMVWLHEQVIKSGSAIVHVTPPTFDEIKGGHPGYNFVLNLYSDWLLCQRSASGWDVADLHEPMNRYLDQQRAKDPKFSFAGDGVHPNDLGHWIMAKQILLHLGAKDLNEVESAQAMAAVHPHGQELLAMIAKRQAITKDAWLTATGHKRPGMKTGLPLAEAQAQAQEIEKKIREVARKGVERGPL